MRLRACACSALLIGVVGCADEAIGRPVPASVPRDGGGGADGSIEAKSTIRIATLNTHLFFDTVCDSGQCGGSGFEVVPTAAAFAKKVEALAKGITDLDADVVALQEVENATCLEALKKKLVEVGSGYAIAELGETGAPASIDVAVLSRGTLVSIEKHRDTPLKRPDGTKTTFSRELLEVRSRFGEREVIVFSAHFRSKSDDDPGRRIAEATATGEIVRAVAKAKPDALVVLGGDLNDLPGSDSSAALEQGGGLLRVASELPASQQGTFEYGGTLEAIDHIYVTTHEEKSRYVAGTVTVVRGSGGGGYASSDHAAVRADFSLE